MSSKSTPVCVKLSGGQVEQLVGTARKREGPEDKTWDSSFAKGAFPAHLLVEAAVGQEETQQELRGTFRVGGGGGGAAATGAAVPHGPLPHSFFFMCVFNTCFGGIYSIL